MQLPEAVLFLARTLFSNSLTLGRGNSSFQRKVELLSKRVEKVLCPKNAIAYR